MTKKEELNFIKMKIGKYKCRCSYKIVGLTDSAIENFNKVLAKGEQYGIYGTGRKS